MLNAYLKDLKFKNLTIHLKEPEKEEQTKPKISRRKEIVNIAVNPTDCSPGALIPCGLREDTPGRSLHRSAGGCKCLKVMGPDVLGLPLFQGTMEYVFELDVSGKVEDVVETLLQVSQGFSQTFTGKLRHKVYFKEFRTHMSYQNHNLWYKSETDLLEYVELENYTLGRSHRYIRVILTCY